MFVKLLFLVIYTISLSAYELPILELPKKNSPEILMFEADSVMKNTEKFYKIKWKTINATDINITLIGKVDSEGSITVTEVEYNRGPITLMASSQNSTYTDKVTINKYINGEKPTPLMRKRKQDGSGGKRNKSGRNSNQREMY